jgi:cephalosporin hydroxylase
MNPIEEFQAEVRRNIEGLSRDLDLQALSRMWIRDISPHKWSYNFSWLGRPAIQFPNDAWAMQEIIWSVRPDLIIETGIAHGGSLIFSASMLALLDMCDAVATGEKLDPRVPKRKVLGVDIDIRAHNRAAIEAHPMSCRIDMIQGSSISRDVIEQVHRHAENFERLLICLDSNHTHEHVLAELEAYAPLTSIGSYCCVFDTIIEDMPADMFQNRPWGRGDNPKTAVWEYLRRLKEEGRRAHDDNPLDFEIDRTIENKLLITVAPDGFLKRAK